MQTHNKAAAAGEVWQALLRGVAPHRRTVGAGLMAISLIVAGCGGSGGGGSSTSTTSTQPTTSASDPGMLLLLVPDGLALTDPQVSAWQDAASEEGVRVKPVTDTQFLAMGTTGAQAYAGLILPDSLHTKASDALIEAVRSYTQTGGRTMLVFDFGSLLPGGFYPVTGPSRLSDLAGVNYVRYAELGAQTTGLGPVTALRSTLRNLLVPPGKSQPCPDAQCIIPPAPPQTNVTTPTTTTTLQAAALGGGSALYLPVSPQDPGGAQGFDPQQYLSLRYSTSTAQASLGGFTVDYGKAFAAPAVADVTRATLTAAGLEQPAALTGTSSDPLEAYTGYLLGGLTYSSYVTQGTFAGTTLAESPQHGLVAGINTVGQGKVLFVNLPLTYLKGRTDALPMHGFLHYFTRNVLALPHLSAMPNGVGGMTFDWHLDNFAAQAPTLALEQRGVFSDAGARFPMEMTAGPDNVVIGDGLGWNLNNNATAKALLQRLDKAGHVVGSHGGWAHEVWGGGATEDNAATFKQYLELNRTAVDTAIGHASRSYSAPEGNNPKWAMTWLEQQGVVAAYFTGHTGLGITRHYRDGQRLNPALWVLPVTPQGRYATFEEWQLYAVPKATVNQWYRDLIDFNIQHNTNRMVYAHPPGAYQWVDVLDTMLAYAKTKRTAGQFAWYTTTELADFMATRLKVNWTQAYDAKAGKTTFTASHPDSLNRMVWRLPKVKYLQPVIVSGSATVAGDTTYWLVKAGAGQSLSFTAGKPN